MPARRNIIPSDRVEVWLPEDIMARLKLHLYSEVEGKIPKGAYQRFFIERLNEFFKPGTTNDQR